MERLNLVDGASRLPMVQVEDGGRVVVLEYRGRRLALDVLSLLAHRVSGSACPVPSDLQPNLPLPPRPQRAMMLVLNVRWPPRW